MESATEADLIAATQQGSILEIMVNDIKYGGGPPPLVPVWATRTMIGLAGSVGFFALCWLLWKHSGSISNLIFGTGNDLVSSLKQRLNKENDSDETATKAEDEETIGDDDVAYEKAINKGSFAVVYKHK